MAGLQVCTDCACCLTTLIADITVDSRFTGENLSRQTKLGNFSLLVCFWLVHPRRYQHQVRSYGRTVSYGTGAPARVAVCFGELMFWHSAGGPVDRPLKFCALGGGTATPRARGGGCAGLRGGLRGLCGCASSARVLDQCTRFPPENTLAKAANAKFKV